MSHFNDLANEWDSPEKIKLIRTLATHSKKKLLLSSDLKILDFGCGTGLFGLEFLEFARELVGVDTSIGMLNVMSEKAKGDPRVRTVNIDLEKDDLAETFDLIISSMAFHHLEHPKKMIKKFSHMLNDGGAVVIVDLDKEDGTFHPDNYKMGVKHFGFDKVELLSWCEGFKKGEHNIINSIEKNNKVYSQFIFVLTK